MPSAANKAKARRFSSSAFSVLRVRIVPVGDDQNVRREEQPPESHQAASTVASSTSSRGVTPRFNASPSMLLSIGLSTARHSSLEMYVLGTPKRFARSRWDNPRTRRRAATA
jgi:hypothetical protein